MVGKGQGMDSSAQARSAFMTWNRALGLCGLFLVPALPLHADSLGDAYRAYEKGQFEEAAKGFQSHAQKQPEDFDQLYNTGVALFQKGAHQEAMSYFDRAMQSPDPDLKSRSAYNKGVALAQQQKWEEAEAAFQNALSYDNDNKMIQDNLQFAREQKSKQKKQDPQQNQAQNNQQQDQKKDGKSEEKQAEDQKGQPQGGKPEEKQAQNQNSQGQSPEQQKSEPGKESQKQAGQEKSAQSDAEKKAAQEAEQKAAQAGQSEAQKQAAQEKPKQKGEMGQPTGGNPGAQQQGERVLTVKDLKKQEAEKILRSVDDRIGTYILTPEQANTEGKSRNGKDW
jgi:tetratricopeptide (TPR) repeat protein